MTRCPDCPLAGLDCPGRRWPAKCARIVAASPEALARAAATLAPETPWAPNPHMARLAAAKACPHRGPCPRGCDSAGSCALGLGDLDRGATATINQCLRCPETEPAP